MTTFTKPVLRELSNQLQTLLDNSKYIGTAKGLNDYAFELGNCKYDEGEATFQLKVLIKGSKSRQERDLEDLAKLSDLDTTKIATLQGMKVSLVGYNTRARKRPWLIQDLTTAKQYVLDDYQARRLFGVVETEVS
tara:strand:- start:1903 stop:2307 length:405 start_codon:yes stop_codon:yes gene_type:complete